MPKAKKTKKTKAKKTKKLAKTPARVYMGYLIWFKVDLWKKTGKKATEAIDQVREILLQELQTETKDKIVVVRKEQPKDTYLLVDIDQAALEDAIIGGANLFSKLRSSELVEYIEVERYAGIKYEEKQ